MNTAQQYEDQGFVAPITVFEPKEAARFLSALEAHELEHGPLSKSERNNPHLLFTWAAEIIRSERLLNAIRPIFGDDLLVWGSTLFIKEPHDPGFVSWHQDSTYWGLEPADVLTAWIALSDSKADNGALQIVPGSHKWEQLEHRDTTNLSNMLSRGQEIAVEVKPEQAHVLELEPGQMSLHHVRMVHGSDPNVSDRRRVGFAVRFLPTHVRQKGPLRDTATLVSGHDVHHNFLPETRPRVNYGSMERTHHAEIEARVQEIIMAGSKTAA